MVIQACKYDMTCYAKSCKFSHPSPGSVGSSNPDHCKSRDATDYCRYGVNCYRARCECAHPSPALWPKKAPNTSPKSTSSDPPKEEVKSSPKRVKLDDGEGSAPKHAQGGTIKVIVTTFAGHELGVNIEENGTLDDLRAKIEEETSIPSQRQRIIVDGTDLSRQENGGSSTLQTLGIKEGTKVEVNRRVYTEYAGQNEIEAPKDRHGNAYGSQYDLAQDGAFQGCKIAVIHLYTSGFDFQHPENALKQKGFEIIRWSTNPPTVDVLRDTLRTCSQLWIISTDRTLLQERHLDVIEQFFMSGKGVYIWGDNEPYYGDANAVSLRLLKCTMHGNLPGSRHVGISRHVQRPGILPHFISTGIERIFEGITIATIQDHPDLSPLIIGSARNIVTSVYDHNGRRAIIDGGFTRLFYNWDDAGTARYVINAASWLANHEFFGEAIFQPS
eukprot:TRINITY_DN17423_c0_g1_i1.p1 TRINITY_DN17423_c0_g1~~TRINITY_DN17423_c0_g1_i1.p1  ORF type:complete len:443 (+),score=101.77 TRINITY_DN17423_c0_g1_i1:116-1444(+)